MDAVSYQMSFDKEQLALLCANYDRRIDSLGAENKRLKAENARLREHVDAAHMSRLLTENENESLRELVRLMWKPFCWAQSYGACLTDEQDAEIRDKVRELGVVE